MRRILIVDDCEFTARATAAILERRLGYVVAIAYTEPTSAADYDLVVTDWKPFGPYQLELANLDDVPCIVWTGSPDAARQHTSAVIEKPNFAALADAVQLALGEGGGK